MHIFLQWGIELEGNKSSTSAHRISPQSGWLWCLGAMVIHGVDPVKQLRRLSPKPSLHYLNG